MIRSINSASTQCAEVAWYSYVEPGSQFNRHLANASHRPSLVAPSSSRSGAIGKPDVCSMTCSMVIASLPFVPNSGMTSLTGAATSIRPSPISAHTAPATNALVAEKTTYARLVGRVAEGLEGDQFAVEGQRHLGRRQQSGVDLASSSVEELLHCGPVDRHTAHRLPLSSPHLRCSSCPIGGSPIALGAALRLWSPPGNFNFW